MREYRVFAQRVGLIGIANLSVALSGIFLLPILTKTLSIEEYGIWVQIMVTIGLIPSLVMFGLPYTMVRFLAGEKKREEIQEGFYSTFVIVLVSSSVISLVLFFLSETIASVLLNGNRDMAVILSAIIFITSLNEILFAFFRTFQQIKKYSLFVFANTYLSLFLVAYFIQSGYGIVGATIGVLISGIILFLVMISLIISEIGFIVPKLTNIKDYLAFGLPTVPGNLSSWVVNSSDRYVIGIFLGSAFVGYYSPGYTLGNIINIFVAPLGIILPAILSKYYDENKLDEAKLILKFSLKYFLLLAIPSSFGLSLLSKPMLTILSTPDIASEAHLITPLVTVSAVFLGTATVITNIIILEKKTSITGSIYILAAVLNFGLNLVFIPYMGILGAAVATLAAYLFIFIAGTYYSFKYLKFEIDVNFILKSVLASTLMSFVIFRWNPEGLSNVLVTVGVCASVYAMVLLLLKGVTREELVFFKNLIH